MLFAGNNSLESFMELTAQSCELLSLLSIFFLTITIVISLSQFFTESIRITHSTITRSFASFVTYFMYAY